MADKAIIEQLRSQIASIDAGGSTRRSKGESERGSARKDAKPGDSGGSDAFSKIVALVNASDKSESTIRDRLAQAGFPEREIEESVERARAYGFIDDMRYACVLIRSRLSQGKGICGIERELRMQAIDIEQVPGWPEEFDASEDAEFDRALTFLETRPPRSKNLREGAYRKLVSKGYSSSVASSAARAWYERTTGAT